MKPGILFVWGILLCLSACGYEPEIDPRYEQEWDEIEQVTRGIRHPSGLVKKYRELADKGNSEAMVSLANAYMYEEGVEFDPHTSMQWYLKAAALGNPTASASLSDIYVDGVQDENGKVFIKDDMETSLMWHYISMKQSNSGFLMEKVVDSMIEDSYKETGVDFDRARERANQWLEEHKT